MARDLRDERVDFVQRWSAAPELACVQLVRGIGLGARKVRSRRARQGKVNEHNPLGPRAHGLEEWEKQKILDFSREYPREEYRRLAFMMLDRDIVAVSPRSVDRGLKAAGRLLDRWQKPSPQGRGFIQPLAPHATAH